MPIIKRTSSNSTIQDNDNITERHISPVKYPPKLFIPERNPTYASGANKPNIRLMTSNTPASIGNAGNAPLMSAPLNVTCNAIHIATI